MVLGVCRRALPQPQDAEDAFQATFLVLAQKAASVSPREMVGNWLYGVARTTALRARAANARRRARERLVRDLPEPRPARGCPWDDLRPLLDQELARLPEKYRAPLVLCCLEDRPRREVARQLHIPEGTLSSRLTAARRALAKRLARHGLALSGASGTAALSQAAAQARVPASLASLTVKAASVLAAGRPVAVCAVSAEVVALTEGVLISMLLTRTKTGLLVLLLVAALGWGAIAMSGPPRAAEGPPAAVRGKPAKPAPGTPRPEGARGKLRGVWKAVYAERDGEDVTQQASYRGLSLNIGAGPLLTLTAKDVLFPTVYEFACEGARGRTQSGSAGGRRTPSRRGAACWMKIFWSCACRGTWVDRAEKSPPKNCWSCGGPPPPLRPPVSNQGSASH
jgi:RNA polymerase sigma factor (sigma-70 family)